MRNSEILEKALEKARKKGYNKDVFNGPCAHEGFYLDGTNYYAIIFDKDFMKAIWGTSSKFLPTSPTHFHIGSDCVLWEWHGKQMLLAEEPLKYLEKNLDRDDWKYIL